MRSRVRTALSVRKVQALDRPGFHADGGGLYLKVGPTGGKSWAFRFTRSGRSRIMGLGSVDLVSLAEAREKALTARKQLLNGIDPLDQRAAERVRERGQMTFKECSEAYLKAHEAGWRNEKHRAQWRSTLEMYAWPTMGDLPVHEVALPHVLKAVEPIWQMKPETASRLRGRIERVLDWATVRQLRSGENPARWKGHLQALLPQKTAIAKVTHHAAVPYRDIGAFVGELRRQPGIAALALEFAILTAARTGEVIGATWQEIDLDEGVWTVPASRMKSKREHRVPLSPRALEILAKVEKLRDGDHVFPGGRRNKPMSNMAMAMVMRRMGRTETPHGFRSAFRDWAAERTAYPNEVAEMALAHVVSDKVERAYRRGDLFGKRRRLMTDWAAYIDKPAAAGEVVQIGEARA